MKHKLRLFFFISLWWLCGSVSIAAGIADMRVEYLSEPLAIEAARPRFSWRMTTDTARLGESQKAWRIVVTDDSGRRVWNSGRVESAVSVGVPYGGEPLRPASRYRWRLTVWRNGGGKDVADSWFETGLMSNDNWSGAEWIGCSASDMTVFAHYLPVFRISFTVEFDRATATRKAAFLYGANDPRLMSADRNILGLSAERDESYIKVELDASADTARLNVYRAGYSAKDNPAVPMASFVIPSDLLSAANIYGRHTVSLSSVLGTTRFFVGAPGREVGRAELNPMGRGGDFIAFPVVGDYGFVVPEGGKARFSDVAVSNYRSPSNVVASLAADTLVASAALRTSVVPGRSQPMLRTEFSARGGVARARLYVTARGAYRFFINGSAVGDDWLAPGFTQYNKTHPYQAYDVTDLVRGGANAMGAVLSEGWWSGGMTFTGENWNYFGDRQSLLAKLSITYADGTEQTVVTDPHTWQCFSGGPWLYSSLFQGEVYDARREAAVSGWSEPGFNASAWSAAQAVPLRGTVSADSTAGAPRVDDYSDWRLVSMGDAPVRAADTLVAQSVTEVRPGVFVYDMGQNMAGVPLVRLRGLRPGTRVALRFAEVCYPDLPRYGDNVGMVMLENIRAAMAQDIYISRGGEELFVPRFTYHGFRYIEVTGVDAPLPLADVRGIVLCSVGRLTAAYECSDADVSRLWQNIGWSMRANFFSVPTDCPQRNERMGWAGDISVFAPTACYMAFVPRFLARYSRAMRDVQRADGKFPDIAPVGGGFGGLLWGSAGITVPWQSFLQYADTAVLADNYEAMGRYIDYVLAETIDPATGIIVQDKAWGDLGDWLGPEDKSNDRSLLWEAYFIHDLDIMERAATVLGRRADALRYARLAAERRRFFSETYINPATAETVWSAFDSRREGQAVGTQTSYVLPLAFGIVPDSLRRRFADSLSATVAADRGFGPHSLMTGFIGTAWISAALSGIGRTDLAYSLLLNRNYPSWLYPVTQGATTIWERLDSYTHRNGFGSNNRMNSFNHYSFGAVGEWLVSRSLGIAADTGAPGFRHFVLRPEPDPTGGITFARGHYDSLYGRIESSWKQVDGGTEYRFTIPANTSATVRLKAARLVECPAGVTPVRSGGGVVEMELGSGCYRFVAK